MTITLIVLWLHKLPLWFTLTAIAGMSVGLLIVWKRPEPTQENHP